MPYNKNSELPDRVKKNIPQGAQTIYREAYNNAYKQYKNPKKRRGNATLEETSNRVAWAAVKKVYKKVSDKWVKRQ